MNACTAQAQRFMEGAAGSAKRGRGGYLSGHHWLGRGVHLAAASAHPSARTTRLMSSGGQTSLCCIKDRVPTMHWAVAGLGLFMAYHTREVQLFFNQAMIGPRADIKDPRLVSGRGGS